MVTGGGADVTFGPSMAAKRRKRREQMQEEDSSDLSDDSDEEHQREAQAIKFDKMPVRMRSGSSPIRKADTRDSTSLSSPSKPTSRQVRRGSQSAVDAVKERARRDTVTSSEMSSENDFEPTARRTRDMSKATGRPSRGLIKRASESLVGLKRQESDLLEEEEELMDSDESDLSEAFGESVDSTSMLDSVGRIAPMTSSPTQHVVGTLPRQLAKISPKKSKAAPSMLQALPPPRPISTILPKSLLSAAIKAKRTKAAVPFEKFAALSGQGDPNPLKIKIWVLFSKSASKFYEVLIRRTVHSGEAGDRQPTVAELIGFSLWRYGQEKLEPSLESAQLNVNKWTLRLVDDEEVDYDFPALDRTKPVVQFTTVNNRGGRTRGGAKAYDEFALVQASDAQFKENQIATPQYVQEAAAEEATDEIAPKPSAIPSVPAPPVAAPRNPLIVTMSNMRLNSTLADAPAPITQTSTRTGAKKLLRVHILSTDATPGQMVTVDVTTDTYMEEVLDIVCKKRQLDKANHVLKLSGSSAVVYLDRTVHSIGNRTDLDLDRRRFATDGPLTMTGSPGSTSPRNAMLLDSAVRHKMKKPHLGSLHPLAREAIKQDPALSANFIKKYTVWRKQPMRFVAMNERVIGIDGEYLHIMPSSTGKTMFEGQGKTTTVHFSNVIGCKVTRRHPTNFKVC